MTDTAAQAIFGILCPLVIGGVFGAAGARRVTDDGRAVHGWRLPLAAGLAVAIAFVGVAGLPEDAWQNLMYVPLVGAAIGVFAALSRRSAVRIVLLLILVGAALACVWSVVAREPVVVKAGAAAAMLVMIVAIEGLLRRRPGPGVLLAIGLAATASSAIILASGWLTLAVPYGALAVALVAIAIAGGVRNRSLPAHGGLVAVAGPLLVLAPLTGWLYATDDLPLWCFALPTIAPLAMWLVELAPRGVREGALGVTARFLLVIAICGIAGYLALPGEEEAEEDDPYADMYRDMMGSRSTTLPGSLPGPTTAATPDDPLAG